MGNVDYMYWFARGDEVVGMNAARIAGRTVVVGMGQTGVSCARYFAAQGAPFAMADTREQPPAMESIRRQFKGIPLLTGPLPEGSLNSARELIVSPGVSLSHPVIASAVAAGVPAIGDIELFARAVKNPVLAITGSNGKSTVTALLGEMARAADIDVAVGGNIGTPALDLLDGPQSDLYVLELSSFQLETTVSLDASVATVLNVSPDHMDRYRDIQSYALAKQRIFSGTGVMVINLDDPVASDVAASGRQIIGFTLHEPGAGQFGLRRANGRTWLAFGEQLLIGAHELGMRGGHNLSNALAALAMARAAGIGDTAAFRALRDFRGLPHRCQPVAEIDGVSYVNDSKGTNVGATVAAIHGMLPEIGRIVLIAGGDSKDADFSLLAQALPGRVRALVLMGRDKERLQRAVADAVPTQCVADMSAAVRAAGEYAHPGDVVLLSPACASFDMYSGYAERGRHFAELVQRL